MESTDITIPSGNSKEDINARKQIIFEFYKSWKIANPEQRRFNISLGDYINIRSVSVVETAAHASKRYLSTLAVLQLDSILQLAHRIDIVNTKPETKNQRPFEKIILMEYQCPAIGTIRLTVGIKRSDKSKVQYCITALEV